MAKADYNYENRKKMFPLLKSQETCKGMIKTVLSLSKSNSLKLNNDVIKSLPLFKIHPWPPGENMDPKSISISFGMSEKLLEGK